VLYLVTGLDLTIVKGKADFNSLTETPAVFLSQNTGHAVNHTWHHLIIEWLNWQLNGEDQAIAKPKFLSNGSLAPFTEHHSKNWE
jgi:hypothetical protein